MGYRISTLRSHPHIVLVSRTEHLKLGLVDLLLGPVPSPPVLSLPLSLSPPCPGPRFPLPCSPFHRSMRASPLIFSSLSATSELITGKPFGSLILDRSIGSNLPGLISMVSSAA